MIRKHLAWLLLAMAPAAPAVPAPQTAIHHCVGADGTPVYTDQPCVNLDAVPVPAAPRAPGSAPPVPVPRFCPVDRATLKQRVAGAFRRRDPNALAGLMLWDRRGGAAARYAVRDLASLVQEPFLGFADEASGPVPAMSGLPPLVPPHATGALPGTLVLELGNPARPTATFRVLERAGCLWLQP